GFVRVLVLVVPFERVARWQVNSLDLLSHAIEQLAGQPGPRVGMDCDGREAVAAHHDRIFPYDLGSGSNLTYRDHPPDSWAPDLHVVDPAHVVSLVLRRTRDDGQKTRFLRVDYQTSAARFAVEADHASSTTCLHGL